jgi:hypothetical protein
VTTTAYLEKDKLALTLDGTTRWPEAKRLQKLGTVRCQLNTAQVRETFTRIADSVSDTAKEVKKGLSAYQGFESVGHAMLSAWDGGLASLESELRFGLTGASSIWPSSWKSNRRVLLQRAALPCRVSGAAPTCRSPS